MVEADGARRLADERLEKEKQARADADVQRQRAQASYRQAVDAVKKMLAEVGDERLAEIPQMQPIRERLLEDAVAFYTKLLALDPGDAETYFARAHVYRLTAKYDLERADLEKAIELDPSKGQYHHVMAFALQYSWIETDADMRRSLFHQQRAAELLPAQDAHEAWASFYARTGQKDKAIAECHKLAEAAQGSCIAYGALAEIARLNGDLREECVNREKAIKAIEQGLVGRMTDDTWLWRYFAANPIPTALAWQHISLAQALQVRQEDAQALTVLNHCLELTGVSGHPRAKALQERVGIYVRQRKFESALTDYDAAMRLDPTFRVGHGRLALLGYILQEAQKYAAAEGVLRECLAIREKHLPESWLRFNAASLLGGALLGQKKYAEAEPLLLQGYEGMKQREVQISVDSKMRLPEAVERIVRLYEATGQLEKARAWREKLKAKVE
jgi:tetratricopeptide (TPR) repeat protein